MYHLKMIGLIFGLALAFAFTFIIFYVEGKSGSISANNFIQAHHTDIDFTYEDNLVIVNDVYCYTARGSSMNPSFFESNTVCFKKYNGEKLKQGNIIHHETTNSTTTNDRGMHRIIAVQNNEIVVRGDNSRYDEIINKSQVNGILVLVLYE